MIMNENQEQYVYCMSNPSLPEDMLKIGWTREHPQKRADDLYTSGIPTPFSVEFIIITPEGCKCEKIIHDHLNTYRVNSDREFFKISLEKLTEILKNELKFELTQIIGGYRKKNKNEPVKKLTLLFENLVKEFEEYFGKFKKEKDKKVIRVRVQNNKKYVSFRAGEDIALEDEERRLKERLQDAYYFINRDIIDYKEMLERLIYDYKDLKEKLGGRLLRSDNITFKKAMLETQKDLHNIRSEYVIL